MNGSQLLSAVRGGDKEPLAEIYRTYRTEFVNWITAHYSCSRDEGQELYQASIVTLFENIQSDKLRFLNGSVKTYLFAIGKNKVMELLRENKKFSTHTDVEEMGLEDVKDWEKQKKENDLLLVQRALQKLGEPCKTMLELYYLHGMSLEELAGHLKYRNGNTIKNMKCRCMSKLRDLVGDEAKRDEQLENDFQ